MRTTRVCLGVLLAVLMLIFPTATAAQGNSETKEACHKGGYLDLMDAEGTPFKNAGECTSHAAQGGTMFAPDLSIAGGAISGTGFTPDSTIVVLTRHYTPSDVTEPDLPLNLALDATGAFSLSGYCALPDETAVEITVTDAAGVSRTESFDIVDYTATHCPGKPD